jgi:hypothetical protein
MAIVGIYGAIGSDHDGLDPVPEPPRSVATAAAIAWRGGRRGRANPQAGHRQPLTRRSILRRRQRRGVNGGVHAAFQGSSVIGAPLFGVGYFIDHGWPALVEYRVKWVCRDAIADPNRLSLSEASREVENIAIERCVYAVRSAGGLDKLPNVSKMMCSGITPRPHPRLHPSAVLREAAALT